MEWINVKDRLPPPSETDDYFSKTVLLYDGDCVSLGYCDYKDFFWYNSGDETVDQLDEEEITHWMPLPESPKD